MDRRQGCDPNPLASASTRANHTAGGQCSQDPPTRKRPHDSTADGDPQASLRELARRFFEDVLNGADPAAVEEIVAERYHEHALAPFGDSEPGVVAGPVHVTEVARSLREQFTDLHITVEHLIADHDHVAALVSSRGTNDGALNGLIPPTGRPFSSRQSHWFRVEHGKLCEHWATRDDLTTMLQLGLIPRPGPPSGPEA